MSTTTPLAANVHVHEYIYHTVEYGTVFNYKDGKYSLLKSVRVHLAGGKSAAVPLYHVLFQNFKAQRTRLAE